MIISFGHKQTKLASGGFLKSLWRPYLPSHSILSPISFLSFFFLSLPPFKSSYKWFGDCCNFLQQVRTEPGSQTIFGAFLCLKYALFLTRKLHTRPFEGTIYNPRVRTMLVSRRYLDSQNLDKIGLGLRFESGLG